MHGLVLMLQTKATHKKRRHRVESEHPFAAERQRSRHEGGNTGLFTRDDFRALVPNHCQRLYTDLKRHQSDHLIASIALGAVQRIICTDYETFHRIVRVSEGNTNDAVTVSSTSFVPRALIRND